MSFFIIGLPRSRTAWLANFMTHDGIFCHHEGIDGCYSLDTYKQKLGNDGDSGTGLMLFDLDKYFPERKKVIIETDIKDSINFAEQYFGSGDQMFYLKERLDKLSGLRVHKDEINERLQEVWEYLTDKPFDKKRADMLVKLNVQVHDIYDYDPNSIQAISSEFLQA